MALLEEFIEERYKEQGTRHKVQGTRHKAQGTRHKAQGTRYKVQDAGPTPNRSTPNIFNFEFLIVLCH